MRVKITLACTECKQRNYNINKYCRFCRKQTLHREAK